MGAIKIVNIYYILKQAFRVYFLLLTEDYNATTDVT